MVTATPIGEVRSTRRAKLDFFTSMLGHLTWGSIRQRCVALSTAESEIVALSATAKHGMALNTTLGELGEKVLIPPNINVRVDNKAAITLAGTNVFSKGLRHVNLSKAFINDVVKKKTISLSFVPSEEQKADIFTKALKSVQFRRAADQLMTPPTG